MATAWHTQLSTAVLEQLNSSSQGLSQSAVSERQTKYGFNALPEAHLPSLGEIFLRQFKSPLIYVLLIAGLIMMILGGLVDALIIAFVLLFNAVVGTFQEGRAQNTLAALSRLTTTVATVRREGQDQVRPDRDLVPGDIILLHAGDKVPADARLLLANNLQVNEAALTGEATPASKSVEPLPTADLTFGDQSNMIFRGTYVLAGEGMAVVVATGSNTALGHISQSIQDIKSEMPLQAGIRGLSRFIVAVVIIFSLILFFWGIATGRPAGEMFAMLVALAVSVIPEGLLVVLTVVLASGVWRMSKRHALVRRLQAVEALGQARVIAVDKTGTITRNEMMVSALYVDGKNFNISGNGYENFGEIKLAGDGIMEPLNHPELLLAGRAAALVANAKLWQEDNKWRVIGDPTEAALLTFARKVGFVQEELEQENPRLLTVPFDSVRRFDATWYRDGRRPKVVVAGAPEAVLALCHKMWRSGKALAIRQSDRETLEQVISDLSHRGLRVLAFAFGTAAAATPAIETVKPLVFGGLFGINDAIRPEAIEAFQLAQAAGIKVVMITGDHKATAKSVAQTVGLYHSGDKILTGAEIDAYSAVELAANLDGVSVFARVTPDHKLRIIEAYKSRGLVIAMTGDGVNDAPSLVAADLGVAMGQIGTEVAKEAADIVLLDDNFGSIVAAVEEGRSIYQTLKKVVLYFFSTSLGELGCIAGAIVLGWMIPLFPGQIIWLNLVTDGFLTIALALGPKEPNLLRADYPLPSKYLVDWPMARRMFWLAAIMTLGSLWLFSHYQQTDPLKASTMALTLLAVFQWFNAWNCRSDRESIFKGKLWDNWYLVGATVLVLGLQLLAVYHHTFQQILRTTALSLSEWLLIILVATLIIWAEEARKWLVRHRRPRADVNKVTAGQISSPVRV